MELEYIGRVYHYLLKYRTVELKPNGRRTRPGEHEIASILLSSSIDDFVQLEQFLSPQGFKLVEFRDDMRGVTSGARTWVLSRIRDIQTDSFISSEKVYSQMKIRETDTNEIAAIWFLHIWLIYLSIVYTRSGRGVSEVSGYLDATFSRDTLEEAVVEHLSHLRKFGFASIETEQKIVDVLDREQGKDITRRISSFLKLMTQSCLVYEISKGEYQQTLLGAHEFADNYNQSLRVPVENVLETLVNIVAPPLTTEDQI